MKMVSKTSIIKSSADIVKNSSKNQNLSKKSVAKINIKNGKNDTFVSKKRKYGYSEIGKMIEELFSKRYF